MRRSFLLVTVMLALVLGGCGRFDVGRGYRVEFDLHCGYSAVSYVRLGGELWQFWGGGSADSIIVTGVLRRLSADGAVFVVDGVSHPLVRVAEYGDARCL